jgi:hypothetical protein
VDGQQYQWAAPTAEPQNVGHRYANTVKFATVPTALLLTGLGPPTTTTTTTTTMVPGTTTTTTPPGPAPTAGDATSSIDISRKKTGYHKGLRVFGTVTGTEGCQAPYDVALYKQRADKTFFHQVRTGTTNESGAWEFNVAPRMNAEYAVEVQDTSSCNGAFSQAKKVLVRAKVGLFDLSKKCRPPYRIAGHLWPRKPGTKVFLRRTDSSKKIDSDVLEGSAPYHLTVPDCGSYRVVWRTQDDLNIKGSHTFGY